MQRDRRYPDHFCALVGLAAVCAISVTTLFSTSARANSVDTSVNERWGEFEWLSPWLEGGGYFREPRDGGFVLSSASFGGRWTGWASVDRNRNSTRVEAQIAIGTRSLISRQLRYAPLSNVERASDPALIDAFAGVTGSWGRFRLGLIPITFGLEDAIESERRWLRPLLLRRGLIGLRDIGVGYSVAAGGFFSDWFVHNGESGDDRDREMWMTARWEYRLRSSRSQWRWGASGQVGRTTPDSTHPAGTTASTVSELDPDQSSRLRFGGLHMASTWIIGDGERGSGLDRRFGFDLEAFGGEILQDSRTRRLRAIRFDLEYEPLNQWGFLLRGEALDPDTQVSNDLLHEAGIGIMHYILPGSLKRSLRGILVATKEWTEIPVAGQTEPRHRVEFVLRFSPDLLE